MSTIIPRSFLAKSNRLHFLLTRTFSSSPSTRNTNSSASFDWSEDEDNNLINNNNTSNTPKQTNLPPPYNPFDKKPKIEKPEDPTNLQKVFHDIRTEGLTNHAIKMFDALSKDGLTHEALELFAVIKDKSEFPDVVAHTAVLEAYANAGGHWKDAVRTFDRMLASGVKPNAYTYAVLVRGLVRDRRMGEARKYLVEMMEKGMRPNAETYVEVFEGFLKEDKWDDARDLLNEMKGKGFMPDEEKVKEKLGRRGAMLRSVMSLLFGK